MVGSSSVSPDSSIKPELRSVSKPDLSFKSSFKTFFPILSFHPFIILYFIHMFIGHSTFLVFFNSSFLFISSYFSPLLLFSSSPLLLFSPSPHLLFSSSSLLLFSSSPLLLFSSSPLLIISPIF